MTVSDVFSLCLCRCVQSLLEMRIMIDVPSSFAISSNIACDMRLPICPNTLRHPKSGKFFTYARILSSDPTLLILATIRSMPARTIEQPEKSCSPR